MKKQLHKKFLAIGVIAILFSASANAQIVYTDVNPDVTSNSTNSTYNLDLNNDGTNDFEIQSYTRSVICRGSMLGTSITVTRSIIEVSPLGTNEVAVTKLELSTNINSSILNWSKAINQTMAGGHVCGSGVSTWVTAFNGYLPLSLISGGNTYYCWARLDTTGADSFTIKDYAYSSVPNQPILAGDTGTLGIDENSLVSKINIFPNPASNQVTISLGSLQQVVELAITDTTGKIVYKTKESET